MGWMWSSQSPSAPKGSGSNSHTPADESNNTKPAAPPSKQAESDYSDPEIAKFMAQLQSEFGTSNNKPETRSPSSPTLPQTTSTSTSSSSSSQPSSTSSSSSLFWSSPTPTPEPTIPSTLDPITESLLPTSMSCRQAFDQAYYCNSLGGQWVSVYRTGGVRSCSELWDDFWFCMRTRTYSGPQKAEAIRARYRAKEFRKYHAPGRPSSTDVWQPRDRLVEPDTAFRTPLEVPDIDDDEWRRLEIERRRRVQEEMQKREA
ncbi:uncharacterized protein F4812DRAFT_413970 [Daldinia caldariorum]|uniref:uncharacterized protein n=1 Tax=Daldinia caldariorum TaxID=326644 RepID=UPI0020085E9C|nr:uncharacterized protein F4812DRAFT_413970 [Daldinia caldariorum]KAI1471414.1 hypothetical protein F4812DRAFT_413970 [Daldinia caldariorum]